MSIEIIKVDARRVLPYYIPFLLFTVGYVLFRKTPLGAGDSILNLIPCIQGMFTAWWIFQDPGETEAFVFSRPLSRKRLFLTRWGFGIFLQILTVFAVFVTITSGLRSEIQELMDSPYYPIVKWYELSVLGTMALFSILGFEVVMFLKLRWRIVKNSPSIWKEILGTGFFSAVCLLPLGELMENHIQDYLIVTYALLLILSATLASLHCYRHLEIQA